MNDSLNKIRKRYASVESPFTLMIKPNQKKQEKELKNEKDSVLQPLISNAYSPPRKTLYSPKNSDDESKEIQQNNIKSVQGCPQPNKSDKKAIAIQEWKELIDRQSEKINSFYVNIENQLLAEHNQIFFKLDRIYRLLHSKFDHPMSPVSASQNSNNIYAKSPIDDNDKNILQPLKIPKKHKQRNIHLYQMKLNIYILYQRFIALSNFRTLNQIGFKKILKKFDKNLKTFQQKSLMKEIENTQFVKSIQCTQCMKDLVTAYAKLFEDGDCDKAKVKLLESISWSNWSNSSSFKVGLKIGALIGLIGWTISALYTKSEVALPQNSVYAYRAIGCFLAFLWFWSGDIYIWSKYRINYVFIFEFEPRTRLSFLQCFDEAATLTIIYFLNAIIFIKSANWMSAQYITMWPTTLLIFFILRLFLPIFDHWKSRQCIINALGQVVIAPFGRVRFRDFFMGDVLTSLVKVLADLYLALCVLSQNEYYTSFEKSFCLSSSFTATIKPICICAPYWFRFAQCLNRYFVTHDRVPHLPNAVKYGTAMSVTLLGTLHGTYGTLQSEWSFGRVIWLTATIISTSYLIFWDLTMDWALFQRNRVREYPKIWYFIAMCIDVMLRYLWTFTLFPTSANPYFHQHLGVMNTTLFMVFIEIAELLRRAIWAIFRVENAHVSRKDAFRSYEYVPIFYEFTSLVDEETKANKPTSMILETVSIFLVVLVVTIVIVLTSE